MLLIETLKYKRNENKFSDYLFMNIILVSLKKAITILMLDSREKENK